MPSDEDAAGSDPDDEMAMRRAALAAAARKKTASKEAKKTLASPRPGAEEPKSEACTPKGDSTVQAPNPEVPKPNVELPIAFKQNVAAGENERLEPLSCPASSQRKKPEDDRKPPSAGILNLPGAGRKSVRTSTQMSTNTTVSFLNPGEKDARTGTKSPMSSRAISKAASDFGSAAAAEKKPSFRNSVRLVSTTNRLSVKKINAGADGGGGSSSSSGVMGGRKTVCLPDTAGRRMTRIATTGSNICADVTPKPRRLPEEEVLSTKEDAWDLLTVDESGQRQRTLTVEGLADIFEELRTSGLDASIGPHLRPRLEGDESPKLEAKSPKSPKARSPKESFPTGRTVTGRHVKYLCMMVVKDQIYEEYPTDPDEIENFHTQLQMDVDIGKVVDNEVRINFKSFKKIVDFVAKMQCLDEALIIMQIVWIKTGRFEMNNELHAAIAAIAKWKDAAWEFKRNQLDILVHSSGVLNKTKKSELNWGNFHQQFDKFLLQKLDLLKERQDRKNAPKPQENHESFAKGYHSNDSVCGRTEFGLWLETVFAFANKNTTVYPSPLAMCVEWIRTSRLLDEEESSSNSDADDEEAAAKAALRTEQDVAFREMKKKAKETESMKDRFKRLDLNSNGSLDFSEFCAFLLSGTPHLSGKELRGLFKCADVNGDGIVVFEEFVDFIHGSEDRLQEAQPPAPDGVRVVFKAYCSSNNEQIDASHFSKILKDAKLVDNELTAADVDVIFNRMRNPKEKVLALPQFERALKECAVKKGVELGEVYEAIWTVPLEIAPKASLDTQASTQKQRESKAGGFLSLGWLKGSKPKEASQRPGTADSSPGRSDGSPGLRSSKSTTNLGVGAKRVSKKISSREA